MSEWIDQVREFHRVMGAQIGDPKNPGDVRLKEVNLRKALVEEEAMELCEALDADNLPSILKEICDVLVVTVGTAIAYGLHEHLDAAMRAVSASNPSKLGDDGKPVRNAAGKVTKGPHYVAPDMAAVLSAR